MYEGIELSHAQSTLICRGLYALAEVDGVHPAEEALVDGFFKSTGGSDEDLKALKSSPFDLSEVAGDLKGDLAEVFIMSCYMLIYADGELSPEEQTKVEEYAAALDMSAARLNALHDQARMYLLHNLADGLKNREVLDEVGTELGLSSEQVDSEKGN